MTGPVVLSPDIEIAALEAAIDQIVVQAKVFGLDFFEMRYEICPADILYTFGAYAMPTRFSHWSFGKAFHQMKTQYDYGMSRVYELVINSDPCYAFLLDKNSLLQNKLIAAHVLAHSDFFKHNYRFAPTNRQMVHTMAAFADRVHQYEQALGRDVVERFLDAVLALGDHIDPFSEAPSTQTAAATNSYLETPYDDLWALDKPQEPSTPRSRGPRPQPEPARDLLRFILEHRPDLKDWQCDLLSSVRAEMLYFRPQMETKIMNEGWASIWHARIMRALDLTPGESLDFARMHAQVLAPNRVRLNPYNLGYHIFEDIERRYGISKLFEVRETETDVSFIRNYLTKDLCARLDLYLFARDGDRWRITETGWKQVRDGIIQQITNCGIPYIYADDHDYERHGALYLRHGYEGVELEATYLKKTLPHVYHIWQRPVHLETVEDETRVLYTYDGQEVQRKSL